MSGRAVMEIWINCPNMLLYGLLFIIFISSSLFGSISLVKVTDGTAGILLGILMMSRSSFDNWMSLSTASIFVGTDIEMVFFVRFLDISKFR